MNIFTLVIRYTFILGYVFFLNLSLNCIKNLAYSDPTLSDYAQGKNKNEQALKITGITPHSEDLEADYTKQIIIYFNKQLTGIGSDVTDIPVEIVPQLNCTWQWLNGNALACNTNEIKPATQYRISVSNKTKFGNEFLSGDYEQIFSTKGPRAFGYLLEWSGPVSPSILLSFDQIIVEKALSSYLYFVDQADKEYKVKVKKYEAPNELVEGSNNQGRWVVSPSDDLPYDQQISLYIKEGLKPLIGDKTVKDQLIWVGRTYSEKFELESVYCYIANPKNDIDKKSTPKAEVDDTFWQPITKIELYSKEKNLLRVSNSESPSLLNNLKEDGELVEKRIIKSLHQCLPMYGLSLVFNAPVKQGTCNIEIGIEEVIQQSQMTTMSKTADVQHEAKGCSDYIRDRDSTLVLPLYKSRSQYKINYVKYDFLDKITNSLSSAFKNKDFNLRDNGLLKDIYNRELEPFPQIVLNTGDRLSNLLLANKVAILEKQIDSDIPVYTTNIDKLTVKYNTFGLDLKSKIKHYTYDKLNTINLAKVQNLQFASPLNIRSLLQSKGDFILFGEVSNEIRDGITGFEPFFIELTPYAVHFKFGYYNSLAWVTDLQTGEPVQGAKVTLFNGINGINIEQAQGNDEATTDANGLAILKGALDVGQIKYDSFYEIEAYLRNKRESFMQKGQKVPDPYKLQYGIMIEKEKEMAFLPFWYDFQINSYRSSDDYIYGYIESSYGYYKAWGTTAQGIYRRGELVQFKMGIREAGNNKLTLPQENLWSIKIFDPLGNTILEKNNLSLSNFGSYADNFQLNMNATVGWYEIAFIKNNKNNYEDRLVAAKFYVSDFTPPPFKVDLRLTDTEAHADQTIKAGVLAKMYSGGPYGKANAEINANVESAIFSPATAKGFYFNTNLANGIIGSQSVFAKNDKLNDQGEWDVTFNLPRLSLVYGSLKLEATVKDARGRGYSSRKELPYIAVDRLVGLKTNQWVYQKNKPASVEQVVVSPKGELLNGIKIDTLIEYEDVTVAKTKTAGNVYKGDYQSNWQEVSKCQVLSSKDDSVACQFTPKKAGNYRVTATIVDSKSYRHMTQINLWVMGDDYVLWNTEEEHALTIRSEKNDYQVGDTARFMVQNPYPGANALITVERNGIIDKFTQKLHTNNEVIELAIKPEYLPGFYLSVIIHAPRSEGSVPKVGQIDLGKPSMRIGYRVVTVNDPYRQLKITAKSDKSEYKPGDRAIIKLAAYFDSRVPESERQPIEFALAVVDAGIFDALDPNYFNIFTGFNQLDHLSVLNYNLISRLVGRQKFETKGANPGGDGGTAIKIRNTDNLTALWLPSIIVTSKDNYTAEASFTIPDNLTEWKIVALALDTSDKSGYTIDSFRVKQNLQITPMMANQIRNGDKLLAGFEVYNNSDSYKDAKALIEMNGAISEESAKPQPQNIKLAPFEKKMVFTSVKAQLTQAGQADTISFLVRVTADNDTDSIKHKLEVLPTVISETQGFMGSTTDSLVSIPITIPEKIEPNISKIKISLDNTILQNIGGIFEYMKTYPYTCWEQKISKALAAAYYQELQPQGITWDRTNELIENTLAEAQNYQAIDGSMLYYPTNANMKSVNPYLTIYSLMAFNELGSRGHNIPSKVLEKIQTYLLEFLKGNDTKSSDSNMILTQARELATLQTLALAALINATNQEVSPEDIKRYNIDQASLFAKSTLLYTLQKFGFYDDNNLIMHNLKQGALASNANMTSSTLWFSDSTSPSFLDSELKTNCAMLRLMSQDPRAPQLINSILRAGKQSFGDTQSNAFCLISIADYAKNFENWSSTTTNSKVLSQIAINNKIVNTGSVPISYEEVIVPEYLGTSPTVKLALGQADQDNKPKRIYYKVNTEYWKDLKNYIDNKGQTKIFEKNHGISLYKEYSVWDSHEWNLIKTDFKAKPGDLIRVDLYVEIPSDRYFVVVNDPLPGGLEILDTNLGTTSNTNVQKLHEKPDPSSLWFHYNDWQEFETYYNQGFYFQEIRKDSIRFYSEKLSDNRYHLKYITQVVAPGSFYIMPSMAQEMYNQDVYGRTSGAILEISQ